MVLGKIAAFTTVSSFGKSTATVGITTSTSFLVATVFLDIGTAETVFFAAAFFTFFSFALTNFIPHLGQSPGFAS